MRMEKRKSINVNGMELHNERKTENHSNQEIDLEKKYLNYDLVQCDNYKKNINEEIKKRYTGKKAIRKDAVLCTEFLFTSNKDFFETIGEEREKLYFEKSLEFLETKFGKENIISAKVHKDESTPHLHAVIVPLHSDGSLSMKKFINGKKDIKNLQDEYYEHISKDYPELFRGKSSEETKIKNLSVLEFKEKTKFIDKKIDNLKLNIASKQQYKECLETIKIIESNAKKKLFSKKITIEEDQFETIVSFAKNYISEKNQINKLKEAKEDLRSVIKYDNDLFDNLCSELFSLKAQLKNNPNEILEKELVEEKQINQANKEYIDILEKNILKIAPEILDKSQSKFLENKSIQEKHEFITSKENSNTLSLELVSEIKLKRKKQRSLGMER